jgi:hypothetical protein
MVGDAMFDPKSRYAGLTTYQVTDRRGRTVNVVPAPPAPEQELRGYHLLRQGQRLDHLAETYLKDAAAFWRICELADVMLPEALTEEQEIPVPKRKG